MQVKQATQKVLELAKSGQKDRAKLRLRQKKHLEKELDKIVGAQSMMDDMINGIEAA